MNVLSDRHGESFDFCMISGHTWSEVGLAACLAEQILCPGGWLILDNVGFSFRESNLRSKRWVVCKPEEEQVTKQSTSYLKCWSYRIHSLVRLDGMSPLRSPGKPSRLRSEGNLKLRPMELLICQAVEQARSDPEFREQLLNGPLMALESLQPNVATSLNCRHFVRRIMEPRQRHHSKKINRPV